MCNYVLLRTNCVLLRASNLLLRVNYVLFQVSGSKKGFHHLFPKVVPYSEQRTTEGSQATNEWVFQERLGELAAS